MWLRRDLAEKKIDEALCLSQASRRVIRPARQGMPELHPPGGQASPPEAGKPGKGEQISPVEDPGNKKIFEKGDGRAVSMAQLAHQVNKFTTSPSCTGILDWRKKMRLRLGRQKRIDGKASLP